MAQPPAPPPHARPAAPPHTPTGVQGAGWQQLMTYQPGQPVPANATRRPMIRQIMLWALAVCGFGLAGLAMGAIVTQSLGPTTAALAALTASVAIGIVVPTFLWVDRLEAEPPRLLWFAFLWGGLVSTLGALLLNELGVLVVTSRGVAVDPLVFGAVVMAPLTEEGMKGLGVLLIFLMARREFDGVTDGIVYAGLVAAGFAFVENILYLGSALTEMGPGGLVGLFVMRVLVSPFAHPMFTVCTGLALGLVAHRRSWSSAWIVVVGLAAAIFLHGLWNYSAVAAAESMLLIFAVVQIPLFVAFVAMLLWARRRESRILRDTLTGYGLNGWYTPAEVAMLADPGERRRARAWAKGVGGRRAERAMEAFQDESGELAMVRKHLQHQRVPDPVWLAREQVLLEAITRHRQVFVPGI